MPLYEYQCDSCGHRFEVIQKFSDLPVDACPTCAGPVQKLLSSAAIQFKGSGWYITDYGQKDKAARTDDAAASATSAAEKTEKSTSSPASDPAPSSPATPVSAGASSKDS